MSVILGAELRECEMVSGIITTICDKSIHRKKGGNQYCQLDEEEFLMHEMMWYIKRQNSSA